MKTLRVVWVDDDEAAITSIIAALRNPELKLTLTTMKPLAQSIELVPVVVSPQPKETLYERVDDALRQKAPYDVIMVDLSYDPENRTGALERGRGLALHLKQSSSTAVGVYTKHSLKPRMRSKIHSDGFDVVFEQIRQLYEDEDCLTGDDWYYVFAKVAERYNKNRDSEAETAPAAKGNAGQTAVEQPTVSKVNRPVKPTLFIGSSVEALPLARALQQQLRYTVLPVLWNQAGQRLSVDFLSSFLANLPRFQFGVFVFAPDDIVFIREETRRSVRDNVVFELGVFVGALGRERTFIVAPEAAKDIRALTDLVGMEPATYLEEDIQGDVSAGLGAACTAIIQEIDRVQAKATAAAQYDTLTSKHFT